MPVVATPIGGLADQVVSGRTGVLAAEVTPQAFANAVRQLVEKPGLYDQISLHLAETHHNRSMEKFLGELLHLHGHQDDSSARRMK
jgi:glycosyltransferase involved in cell wall biosynthesis